MRCHEPFVIYWKTVIQKLLKKEQALINRNIKTERQHHTLEKGLNSGKLLSRKKQVLFLASQEEASNWLSVLPLKSTIFSQQVSLKSLHLRFGWEPPNTPQTCPCGQPFALTQSLHCPKDTLTEDIMKLCDTPGRSMPKS